MSNVHPDPPSTPKTRHVLVVPLPGVVLLLLLLMVWVGSAEAMNPVWVSYYCRQQCEATFKLCAMASRESVSVRFFDHHRVSNSLQLLSKCFEVGAFLAADFCPNRRRKRALILCFRTHDDLSTSYLDASHTQLASCCLSSRHAPSFPRQHDHISRRVLPGYSHPLDNSIRSVRSSLRASDGELRSRPRCVLDALLGLQR